MTAGAEVLAGRPGRGRWHVLIDDRPACGAYSPAGWQTRAADTVAEGQRCQRRGCQNRWPIPAAAGKEQ